MQQPDEIIQQQVSVPFQTVTETPINTAGPGPFYIYSPGLTFTALRNMVYFFNTIPSGQIFRISSGDHWTAKGQLPEGAASKKREIKNFFGVTTDEHHAREIPAQDTLYALLSDRSLTDLGLIQIVAFDKIDAAEDALNLLICPDEILREQSASRPFSTNAQWRKIQEEEGTLRLRRIWLEAAAEGLDTGRVLEDINKAIEARPYLREVWKDAIVKQLIPAIDTFTAIANVRLADKEEKIRAGEMKIYDPFCLDLMWLLGRKPERTALSRTLENASRMNQGGIGVEEIKTIVQSVMSATTSSTESIRETCQCPDCGEDVKMIMGAPPRKCRFCGYEFRALHQSQIEDGFDLESKKVADDDEIARLAAQIQSNR